MLTLTTNDTLDTFSLLANWTGAATTVQVRFVNQGGGDRLQVWNSAGTTQVPFGTIDLGRNDFTTSTLSFNGSTMTQANGVITVVLGASDRRDRDDRGRQRQHDLDTVRDRNRPCGQRHGHGARSPSPTAARDRDF